MGLASRILLIGPDDRIHRLASATFDRMLRDPSGSRLPLFAGQRVRLASLVIELDEGQPVRVVRRTFAVLAFDQRGCIDVGRFGRQQSARVDLALAPVFGRSGGSDRLVEAANRFVAQGGRWTPPGDLARAIDRAAMGYERCLRLRVAAPV
jgi:hypothetical protein